MTMRRMVTTSIGLAKNVRDEIHIRDLSLETISGPDSWKKLNPQKCKLSLNIQTDFSKSSKTDDLKYSLNYAVICRDVSKYVQSKKNWNSIGSLTRSIYDFTKSRYSTINALECKIKNEDYHLRTNNISCTVYDAEYDVIDIKDLELFTVIGVFNFERLQKQRVCLDIGLKWPKGTDTNASIQTIIDAIVTYVEGANFKTVEALIENVGGIVAQTLQHKNNDDIQIYVKVLKLSAITDTNGVGVSCSKNIREYENVNVERAIESSSDQYNLPVQKINTIKNKWNTAYLAFGSNIGDRLSYIEEALELLKKNSNVKIISLSSLFESEPMYFRDQSPFMNGCIEIRTLLSPNDLLKLCKYIEYNEMRRVKHFDNGPRCIDLDIIMFINSDGEHILLNEADLIIPHPRMLERTFVLEPLCELISPTFSHPITAQPIIEHLEQIYTSGNEEDNLWKLVPLPTINHCPRFLKFKTVVQYDDISGTLVRRTISPTYIMGILNTTPDSFSDGGKYLTVDSQISHVQDLVNSASTLHDSIIIDIGGCSTRPGSKQATIEEELMRTIPIIEAIRNSTILPQEKIILSIDTYRAEVAKEAIKAGVDIVNDISGGSFDSDLFRTVANYPKVAYVLSHIRGDVNTMNSLTEYEDSSFEIPGVDYIFGNACDTQQTKMIRQIGRELSSSYAQAVSNGIKRWQIILDPGIGFAKKGEQNLKLIRQMPLLKNYCFVDDDKVVNLRNIPVLIGPSRKKFIGMITNDEVATDRDFATGSISASCVGFGADIIRVHNVHDCSKSIKLADALYKLT